MSRTRRWVMIRKQRFKQQPNPALRRWIAACQRCSRACSSLEWGDVIGWADDHPGHCSQAPFPFYPHIRVPPVQLPILTDDMARLARARATRRAQVL